MTRARTIHSAAGRWWVPVGAVVVVLALVLLAGGFDRVRGTQGLTARAGDELTLERWVLVVHDAELVAGPDYDPEAPPEVLVRLRATFTGETSTYGFGTNLLTLVGPPGTAPLDASPSTDGDRSGGFDPDVAQDITLRFRWPDAPSASPQTVRLLVRDEEIKENYLFAPEWGARAEPSLHLDLPCPDRRAGR